MAELIRVSRQPNPTLDPPPVLLPEELIREILTWLPSKSLMRFKCVSKIWRSMIWDPSFAKTHRGRGGFRGLIVSEPYNKRLAPERYFFYLSLPDDGGSSSSSTTSIFSHRLTEDHGGIRTGCTNIVNGLVCFYRANYSYLYNIATRERLQLPFSTYQPLACSYHIGFDPISEVYKLLKICPVYDNYDDDDPHFTYDSAIFVHNLNCEILTTGVDSSWRTIESLPPMEIITQSVCFDGVLYWAESIDDICNRLIAFHLVEEKFQRIPTPKEDSWFKLPRFGPNLALISLCSYRNKILQVSIFHHLSGNNGRDTNEEGGRWADEQKFNILDEEDNLAPQGILPNGKVVISDIGDPFSGCFYLFDPSYKRELQKIVLHVFAPPPSSLSIMDYDLCNNSSYYEENILPLSRL